MRLSRDYTFNNPTRIIFGSGRVRDLSTLVSGQRVCLITSPGFTARGLTKSVADSFRGRLASMVDTVQPNPDIDSLDVTIARLRAIEPDAIVAVGGGSVLDSGKVLARAMCAPLGWSLAKHFRDGEAINTSSSIPCYAVPTTAGTGAEVTPFATVWDNRNKSKHSLAGIDMFPAMAIVDPSLTVAMPPEVTLSTGLDALSQALESIWNRSCNDITFGWATSALRLSVNSLIEAVRMPDSLPLRCDLAQSSLLAGLSISHTRTALAHSISYPITANYGLPHGFACSFTLPALLRFNAEVDDGRLHIAAKTLGLRDVQELGVLLQRLLTEAQISLYMRRYVRTPSELLIHLDKMLTPGRSDNNLRAADLADVRAIVMESLEAL